MDSPLPSQPLPDPRDKKKYYLADTPQRRMLIAVAKVLFKPIMKMEASGLENFLREGAVILVANHVTNFDVFPASAIASKSGRNAAGINRSLNVHACTSPPQGNAWGYAEAPIGFEEN